MRETAVVFGTFDGLHKGHKSVLSLAEGYKKAVAVTFPFPPAMEEKRELLMSTEQKNRQLADMGFEIETLNFGKICGMEAENFLNYIDEKFSPASICCGFNYRFGHCAKGDAQHIKRFCEQRGIKALIAEAASADGIRISSSFIRELIKRGEVERASRLLMQPFSVCGEVSHGDSRGRTMGIPTVNFPYPENIVEARHGVYAARAEIEGESFPAVTYIGRRPTYELEDCICETNILDFSGDLYGKTVRVSLLFFLRDDRKFNSISELKNQIEIDIEKTKHLI